MFKALRIGVPKEYFVEGMQPEVEKSVRDALAKSTKKPARTPSRFRCRTLLMRSPRTISSRTAEASANLSRYDGIRYGLRVPAENNIELL